MNIELSTAEFWNENRLTVIEEPTHGQDTVLVCINGPEDGAMEGTSVRVFRRDLIRLSKILALPHDDDPSTDNPF